MTFAKTRMTRRTLLTGAAAIGVAAPFVSRRALAQSPTVNIFAWAGYVTDEMLAKFEADTGIRPVFTPYGTNDELLNQMRASNGAGLEPSSPH